MKRLGAVVLVSVLLAVPASADDFDNVVKHVESRYGIQRTHPRLIGFALFLARPFLWGGGVGGLQVAAFENVSRSFKPSLRELNGILAESLSPGWKPFVRVDSRRNGEVTVIYSDCGRESMSMIIASVDRNDFAVVHLKISGEALRRWMSSPGDEARETAHKY